MWVSHSMNHTECKTFDGVHPKIVLICLFASVNTWSLRALMFSTDGYF